MLFIFQQTGLVSIWVAIIGALGSVITGLGFGTLIMWKLNKSKFVAEVKGQEAKNYGEWLGNHNLETEAIVEAMTEIAKLRKDNLQLGSENHRLQGENQLKNIQIAKAQGATELALKERDDVVGRIKTLEDKVEYEHRQCQQQVMEIGIRYMGEINHLKQVLADNNITVPPMPVQPSVSDITNGGKNDDTEHI